jgi:hypothetical protein
LYENIRKAGDFSPAFHIVTLVAVPTAKPEEQITTGYAGVVKPL